MNLLTFRQCAVLLGILISLMLTNACTSIHNANSMSQKLSLDKLYGKGYFSNERSPHFVWLDDGSGYTIVEKRSDENSDTNSQNSPNNDPEEVGVTNSDIVFYKPDGSGKKVLISFEDLVPQNNDKAIKIDAYSWSNDGKWALIYTRSKKVWRSNSRGDYYLLNLTTKDLRQIGPKPTLLASYSEVERSDNQSSQLMFAKFSPNSQQLAYVYKNNIYVEELEGRSPTITALTTDGGGHIINGNFDWVYEEEFSIRDGFRWSPDSQNIAYWQFDTSEVQMFHMINNTDSLYPKIVSFPYPKAGETNSAVNVGVVNVKSGVSDWLPLEGDKRDRYIPRITWANANELLIQDVNRPQQVNKLRLYNIKDSSFNTIFTDKDDAFIENFYEAKFINQGEHFIWHSERDAWRNLYRISRDGKEVVNLTPGGFDILSMLAFNEQNNEIYFTASPTNATQSYLYKASLDGSLSPTRVTPSQYSGYNTYTMSKDTSNALHRHSNHKTPSTSQTIKVAQHETVRSLSKNEELKNRLAEHELPNVEFITLNARDKTQLDAYVVTPKNLDKRKKYPLIVYVYGEPAGQTVQDRWGGQRQLFNALLAEKGFVVVSIDNRGTRSPKGRDWRKSIYKKIGTITAQDQVDALDEIAKRYSFIDTDRVGVYGHSGGGSSTLTMLFKYPEKYHAGVAIAPVPDISLYDTIYQERYSGHPKTDPESYFNTSSINFVENFSGKLLLIHGTGDDNVHYQGAERLINALVEHNKTFEFMAYPNRAHGIRKGKNTLLHRQSMVLAFFEKHLK